MADECKKILKQNSSILLTFVVAAALLAFVSIVKPGYSNPANLKVLSISVAVLGFTALGQTFSILTGGMDLSVPWIFCIGGYLCAMLTGGENAKLIYAVPAVLLVGALMGAVNGFGIAYVGIAPVIMTMASNIIYQKFITYELELQISHSASTEISQESDIRKAKKRYWKNTKDTMRLQACRIEAHAMPDHIHMLVSIPPKLAVADFMGYLKGKSTLMIFERHANLKYKYGRRVFWVKGYYVNTVGGNEATPLIFHNRLHPLCRDLAFAYLRMRFSYALVKFVQNVIVCN